jgi:hypothetical protein
MTKPASLGRISDTRDCVFYGTCNVLCGGGTVGSFLGYVSGLTGDFPGGFWRLVHGWL